MTRASVEGYGVFRRFANLATKHPRLLVTVWLLLFVVAIMGNQVWRTDDVIEFTTTLPEDTESARAQRIIEQQFPRRLAESTATIVLVAPDATSEVHRWYVADLHAAIVAATRLAPGETAAVPLRTGGSLTVDHPLVYMADPGNATIYAVYFWYAHELARQFLGPVHEQVAFTRSATGIYWGLPAYFLGAWSASPGPFQNETAKAATEAYIGATFPPAALPWANGSFAAFYQGWNASWSNGSMAFFPPDVRTEVVVGQTLPGFLASPLAAAMFPPEQIAFQFGMLLTFDLGNFADPAAVEAYALAVFPPIGVADLPFFEDLHRLLDANATAAEIRRFAEDEALRYDVFATPLRFPVNVTSFFVSGDRTIVLMSYAFTKEPRFMEDRTMPIADNVHAIRDIVARLSAAYRTGAEVYLTGSAPLDLDQEEILEGGAEFIATVLLVIILIGLYFRSAVSPGLPILTIAIALLIANLFVFFVAVYLLELHFTVTAVMNTIILAVGTDYSIFLVSRYRDERRDGTPQREAVRNAVIWAGESVATSGGAVLIAFAALSLGSFPIVRGMGIVIGFAVTVALLLALTFIPAVLMIAGTKVFWPSGERVARVRPKGELTASERYFRRAAAFSMRHARAVVLVAILITIPATYIVVTDRPSFDLSEGVPTTESQQGIEAIGSAFGEGFLFPSVLVVQFPDRVLLPDGNVSVPKMDALRALGDEILAAEPGVRSLEGPTNPQGTPIDYRNLSALPPAERAAILGAIRPFLGSDGRTVRINLVLEDPAFSGEAIETIDRVSVVLHRVQAREPEFQAAALYLGGVSAILGDLRDSTNRDLQIMAAIVVVGLFIVLLFVLGSVLIPLRAILTILLSIAWTLALTIVLFHFWLGLDIVFILPLILFVMAMGLGMDYDIFIITRVREEVAKGASDPDAILHAVTRTGGIISACGIIMAGAFATLMLSPLPFLKEIGFALAFVILLDSTVVRIYLVPAIMVLAGKYNWWAPGPLQRIHREEGATEPAQE